ncbi:NAD(P)/FAD-dependent oxidoreductase [Leucobacter denitrificans]|uniref:FAD-binding oxidoreductase n=1 Tax=Leucobacter denitrificans TaxID=683042 RepID=A0A7G9S2B0_9MICO|nr:FAD-dependent oxidoreductase [Leucobacter denitrificans]QNN61985.1 FAD-binding oxidoreductase [Leucobacter denitrificans]
MQALLDSADVVVIGAGISGITTAFELKSRGFDVVVLEQRFPSYGASGRNAGSLWIQTCRSGTELELSRAGQRKYLDYIDELGNTFDYRQNGGLFFFETEEQGTILEEYVSDRRALGLEIEMLDQESARRRSELVPRTAIGAVYCAEDAQLSSPKFVRAVASASARAGVRIYENTSALSTIRNGDIVSGVRTVRGDVMAPALVWATGAWSVSLDSEGIEIPLITARQGQLIMQATTPIPDAPIMKGPRGVATCTAIAELPSFKYSVFEHDGVGSLTEDVRLPFSYEDMISQSSEGVLWIGSSFDGYGSLNPHIGLAASKMMVDAAFDRYPEKVDLGIVGLWAGVASWTDDALPVIDRVDGAYVNVGHANGIATGPIGGQLMAETVMGETGPFHHALRSSRLPRK